MREIPLMIVLILLFSSTACARKNSLKNFSTLGEEQAILPPLKPSVLDSIHSQIWRWYYGKFNVSYADSERKLSFKMSLKCSKDSATNALISFMAIPIFNTLITSDSLIYVNKKNRCFGAFPAAYLNKLLGIELSLQNLQELFLGLPIAYQPMEKVEWASNHPDTLIFKQFNQHLSMEYFVTKRDTRLTQQRLILSDGRSMLVRYLEWNNGTINTPSLILIRIIEPGNEATIKLTVDRFELNIPQEISLEIPENYEKCP